MSEKVHKLGETVLVFHCPACHYDHPFRLQEPVDQQGKPAKRADGTPYPTWEWNGSIEKPTFKPSLLVHGNPDQPNGYPRCHSFVRDGKIEFCSDSTHALAGQTVDLPDYD